MPDEVVDHIDPENRVIGPVSKREAHIHGWLHRTVIADVRTPEGNIVLVRQAADRQDAGQYVCPVGGHVQSGESELDALHREAYEEIGVAKFESTLIDRFIYERHVIGRHENHLFIMYQIILDPARIVLGPESVDFREFTPSELTATLKSSPKRFGDSFIVYLEHNHPDLLPN